MLPFGLDHPPNYDDGIMPEWAHDIADTFDMLFWSQTWKEEGDWAEYFDMVAQRARCGYVEEGLVIISKCYHKYYKEQGIQTFEEYVKKIVRKPKWQAVQLMQAATVGWHLICQGFEVIPTCVSQAMALLRCVKSKKDDNVTLASAWEQCLNIADGLGQNITAHFIEVVIGGKRVKQKKNIKVDVEVHEGLCKQAHERGLTLGEFLIKMSKGKEPDEQPDPTPSEEHQTIDEPEQEQSNTENDIRTTPTFFAEKTSLGTGISTEIPDLDKESEIPRPEPPY